MTDGGARQPGASSELSILFDRDLRSWPRLESGDFIVDLHLDEIAAWILAGRDVNQLRDYLFAPCPDVRAIKYRQAVFQDLEAPAVAGAVRNFGEAMSLVRMRLARAAKSRFDHERERWLLEAADLYAATVETLANALAVAELRSDGLSAIVDHLMQCLASDRFVRLRSDAGATKEALDAVVYRVRVSKGKVTVSGFRDEPDYGAEILATFERFRVSDVKPPVFEAPPAGGLDHVEGAILAGVAQVHPAAFAALARFAADHANFLDPTIGRFDREVQLFLAFRERIESLAPRGLAFCYPEVSDGPGETLALATYDLALAAKPGERTIMPNDLRLRAEERLLVVTGPNQGGKTTFARAIGQLHHLARIGFPVPGTVARVGLVDAIHTHFERSEDLRALAGKLESDLARIHEILTRATRRGLLLMNESFSSTTVDDALFLNELVLHEAGARGMLAVVVTFLDELATLTPTTVSMVGAVDPMDPAHRTFRFERRPADGLAYAIAIARKHDLTYERVKERIPE